MSSILVPPSELICTHIGADFDALASMGETAEDLVPVHVIQAELTERSAAPLYRFALSRVD